MIRYSIVQKNNSKDNKSYLNIYKSLKKPNSK